MTIPLNRMDVELTAMGDHHGHYFDVDQFSGIHATYDQDSHVLNLTIDEITAKDLYFWLLSVIPKLQKDRR